jgi:hypothetical protein
MDFHPVLFRENQLAKVSGKKETGQADEKSDLSSLVGQTGFEPATPTSRT